MPNCSRGHEVRQQRLAGRHRERPRDSEQHHHREHRPRRVEAARGDPEQQQRTDAFEREAERQYAAAVVVVRDVSRRQDQQHEWQELRQADQPQIERVARDFVDLPADRDRLHLHGQRGEEARRQEEREVAIAEDGEPRASILAHAATPRVIGFIGRGSIARHRTRSHARRRSSRPVLFVADRAAALPSRPAAARGAAAAEPFEALGKRYLDEFGRYSPVDATALGDHRFDGDLDDLGAAGRGAGRSPGTNRCWPNCERIDRAKLSRANQVDAAVLDNQLRYAIWTEKSYRDWSWDPLVYTQLAGQALYGLLARDFAPLPDRLRSLTVEAGEAAAAARAGSAANLVPERVPAIHAETAVKQNPGVLSLVDELVVPTWAHCRRPTRHGSSRDRDRAGRRAGAPEVARDRARAEGTAAISASAANSTTRSSRFALMSPLSRQDIRSRAEAEVVRTRSEMYDVARKALAGRPDAPALPDEPTPDQQQAAIAAALALASAERPAPDGIVDYARATLAETTAFVRAKNFVSMPDEPLEIILMPVFQRGVAVAYCDSPGRSTRGSALSTRYRRFPRTGPRRRWIPSCASTTGARSRT